MAEKNKDKKTVDKSDKNHQRKKSAKASSSKTKEHGPDKKINKSGSEHNDYNDPTGNSHLAD